MLELFRNVVKEIGPMEKNRAHSVLSEQKDAADQSDLPIDCRNEQRKDRPAEPLCITVENCGPAAGFRERMGYFVSKLFDISSTNSPSNTV